MLPSHDYVFSFDVQNGNCNSACPSVSIITNGLEFNKESCGDNEDFVISDLPRSLLMIQGMDDACAGKVHAPLFTTKTISECTTVNSDPNLLTVTLVSNVNLVMGTKISLSGLIASNTSNDDVTLSGRHGHLFNSTWFESSGKLSLVLRDDNGFSAGEEIVFSFTLTNPDAGVGATAVQPTVGAESPEILISESTMSGMVLGAGSTPSLTVADIGESSAVQLSYNTLMVLIKSNARIPENSLIQIWGWKGVSQPGNPGSGFLECTRTFLKRLKAPMMKLGVPAQVC